MSPFFKVRDLNYIRPMTKQELVAEMKRLGVRDSRMKHPLWEEAFKQYNAANPNNKVQYSLCGSCFSKVSNWLNT